MLIGLNSRPPRGECTTVAARRGEESIVGTGTAAALTNGSAAGAGENVIVGVLAIRPGVVVSAPGAIGDNEPRLVRRDILREVAAMERATRRHLEVPRIPTAGSPLQQWGKSDVKACITTHNAILVDILAAASPKRDHRTVVCSVRVDLVVEERRKVFRVPDGRRLGRADIRIVADLGPSVVMTNRKSLAICFYAWSCFALRPRKTM